MTVCGIGPRGAVGTAVATGSVRVTVSASIRTAVSAAVAIGTSVGRTLRTGRRPAVRPAVAARAVLVVHVFTFRTGGRHGRAADKLPGPQDPVTTDHARSATCSATIPPVMFRKRTWSHPQEAIVRANASWAGHARIDSAR